MKIVLEFERNFKKSIFSFISKNISDLVIWAHYFSTQVVS